MAKAKAEGRCSFLQRQVLSCDVARNPDPLSIISPRHTGGLSESLGLARETRNGF